MRVWFCVGDSIDWLESQKRASGIIRVTIELLSVALDRKAVSDVEVTPCIPAPSTYDLAAVESEQTLAYIAEKIAASPPANAPGGTPAPEPKVGTANDSPKPGDFVLFTGVAWKPNYSRLFRQLSARGIPFGALVYDIIPIERPDFVSVEYQHMFATWLEMIVAKAQIVFVSSGRTKDQILRWAALVGVDVAAQIVPVTFGSVEFGTPISVQELAHRPKTNSVNLSSFVLSVGTIDRRKNQIGLCKIWCQLISELGAGRVPQLVLAGRNDMKPRDFEDDVGAAMKKSQIVIVEDLSDQELAGLYSACLFTVFPSLAEGYGLPVAESLQSGKLCIASHLPVIKEHAGTLAWYFDPQDEKSIVENIRLAITRPDLRLAAEQAIARGYHRTKWASTFGAMAEAIRRHRG